MTGREWGQKSWGGQAEARMDVKNLRQEECKEARGAAAQSGGGG